MSTFVSLSVSTDLSMARNCWLPELRYKPGWRFDLADQPFGSTGCPPGAWLGVYPLCWDSTRPDLGMRYEEVGTGGFGARWILPEADRILLRHELPLRAWRDREGFRLSVLAAVIAVETHEAMEFLRDAAGPVLSPHGVDEYDHPIVRYSLEPSGLYGIDLGEQ